LEVQRVAPFPVIIGEEIKSASGDIIGLFLKEEVPPGLLPVETARRVKDQGGLVVVPHPFCRLRPTTLKRRALEEILPLVDLIEGFNSHTVFYGDNSKGAEFARQHSVPIVASSDSHSALELGNTFTEINENDYDGTPEGLLRAVASGHLDRKRPNPLLLMAPGYAKLRKMLA
jgi:predicted metal-dependent phosphoesterase TrpH